MMRLTRRFRPSVISMVWLVFVFFFNDPAPTEIYTLSLHDALPICGTRLPSLLAQADHRGRPDPARLRAGAGFRSGPGSRPRPAPPRAGPGLAAGHGWSGV